MRRIAFLFVAACLAVCVAAADTWQWLGKTNVTDAGVTFPSYGGKACFALANWRNIESGTNGIPQTGDFVVSTGVGNFGQDFGTSLVFGGVTVTANVGNEFVSQGTLALQAGGPGLVVSNNVSAIGTANGSLAFVGSGEAVVDIRRAGTRLKVQKSFYGNANVTLVKRGAGILQVNDGYAPDVAATQSYAQPRSTTGGYYPNRKFVFGGVKLQGGTLDLRQYYWVRDCDFQFDGNSVTQAVMRFPNGDKSKVDLGVHSLELQNCSIRETANVTGTTHAIYGEDARCYVHMFGDSRTDSSFSGKLVGGAGLVWEPTSPERTFTFSKSVSPTTGILIVSNGTVRVTDGAGLPNVSAITVDGANSRFAVEATAPGDYSAVPFVLANGAALSLADGTRLYVKSVTVDGTPLAEGTYAGVSWIAGGGCVVVGGRRAVWNGSGTVTTLANWQGASSLPPLDSGITFVDVVGGTSLVADVDAAFDGFSVGTTPFALSAAAGRELRLGAAGLTSSVTGALTVGGGGGDVVVAADQDWNLGDASLTFGGDVVSDGHAVYYDSSKSPSFAGGVRIGCDLWFIRGATLTCPRGADLTFDGLVSSTNSKAMSVTAPEGSTITFNRLMMSRNGGTLNGAGRIVFNDSVHFRDRPNMSGTVTVELHRGGNRLNGNMGTFSGGTLKAMAPYVITWSNTVRQAKSSAGQDADAGQNTMINAKGAFTLDLNGFDQSIDIVAMHADGTAEGGRVFSPTPATLHLVTSASYWPKHNYRCGFSDYSTVSTADGYGYETADKGRWTGAVNLSYEGAADKVRSMMRTSSSTGCVEVVSGKLVFLRRARTAGETFDLKGGSANPYPRLADEDGAWPLATAVAVKGGTLKLEHSLAFGRDVDVSLSTGGTLELAEGVVFCCRSLAIDGVRQEAGRYYDAQSTSQIVGAGRLYVRGDAPSATVYGK